MNPARIRNAMFTAAAVAHRNVCMRLTDYRIAVHSKNLFVI